MEVNNIDEKLEELSQKSEKNLEYAQSILKAIPADQQKIYKEILELIKNNLEYSKSTYAGIKKIQKWIFWQKVFGVVKWVVIIVPIAIGIIYLPQILNDVLSDYKVIMDATQQGNLLDQLMQQTR